METGITYGLTGMYTGYVIHGHGFLVGNSIFHTAGAALPYGTVDGGNQFASHLCTVLPKILVSLGFLGIEQ